MQRIRVFVVIRARSLRLRSGQALRDRSSGGVSGVFGPYAVVACGVAGLHTILSAIVLKSDARSTRSREVAGIPSTSSGQALRRAKDALLRMTRLDNRSWCGVGQRRPQTCFSAESTGGARVKIPTDGGRGRYRDASTAQGGPSVLPAALSMTESCVLTEICEVSC